MSITVDDRQTVEDNIQDIYPLSPMQEGLLFHSLFSPQGGIYFEQMVYRVQGELHVAHFQKAWQEVLNRHSILRTAFYWEETEKPLQVVFRDVALPFTYQDWSQLSGAEQESRLEEYLQEEREQGFELTMPPLLKVSLIQMDADVSQVVLSFHHLLLDGWSLPLLLGEVFALYRAYEQERSIVLESSRSFKDYILWLNEQDTSRAEQYWRKTLAGFQTPTVLQIDRAEGNSAGQAAVFSEREARLSPAATAALQALARQSGVTLNTMVQGAWSLLLSRYSGEKDVVFGTVLSGRSGDLAGIESMVGMFINTLPVRVKIPKNETVLSWLKTLQEQQVELRQYEYSSLLQVQGWSEIKRGQSLFDSVLVFENYPVDEQVKAGMGGLSIEAARFIERTNYPLSVLVAPDHELMVKVIYDSIRFGESSVERMVGHLLTLLEQMAENPEGAVEALEMMTEAERRQIVEEFNDTAVDYPSHLTVTELFEEMAAYAPDRPILFYQDQSFTYRELDERASGLAYQLKAMGVQPNELVAVFAERSPEMVISVLAILKAGGAFVPIDPDYPRERIEWMLQDCNARVMLASAVIEQMDVSFSGTILNLSQIDWNEAKAAREAPAGDEGRQAFPSSTDICYVMYTSGSTGRPKGVMVSHRNVVRLVKNTNYAQFDENTRILQAGAPGFDACTYEIWGALLNGGRLYLVNKEVLLDAGRMRDVIQGCGITDMFLSSPLFNQLSQQDSTMFAGMKTLLVGGDVVSAPHAKRVARAAPDLVVGNAYGPTENTTFSTFCPVGKEPSSTIPIGRPIHNSTAYIVDEELRLLPIGLIGELVLGGDGVALGYLNRPELTAEKFVDSPFRKGERLYRTGDLARFLPNGEIEYLGRTDDQVKIRGFRVELGEIMNHLADHPAVKETVVVVRMNAQGTKELCAYYAAESAVAPDQLRDFLAERLPAYMIPSRYVHMERLPLNTNGKVDKSALPEPDETDRESSHDFAAPRTQVERALAEIWQEVLGHPQIGIHDNFFELGGDSILTIRVIALAKERELSFSPKDLFENRTIAQLARVVKTGARVQSEQGLVVGEVPLTPIQHWFFEQEMTDPHHFNHAVLLIENEPVDPELFERAVEHLVRHHDTLRLRYEQGAEGWRQRIADWVEQVFVERIELTGLSAEEQQAAMMSKATEIQSSISLTEGPIIRAARFALGGEKAAQILIVVHHLAVDGVSWRILLDDLQTVYQQLKNGEEVRLPQKTTSFKQWAERLAEHAESTHIKREAAYWRENRAACKLPTDHELAPGTVADLNTVASQRSVAVSLSAKETKELLQEVPKAYQTQIHEVLLGALAQTLAVWTGERSILIDLEGHGRETIAEDLDCSRTVGWFTCLYPLALTPGETDRPGEVLKAVKEQVRRVPNGGIGYGLIRYLADEGKEHMGLAGPRAEISFNYLGQFDEVLARMDTFTIAQNGLGPERSPRQQRRYLLEVNGKILGGRLGITWNYSENIHLPSTVEKLAEQFIAALRELISHCLSPEAGGYTPSDFPEAELDQSDLDALMKELSALKEGK